MYSVDATTIDLCLKLFPWADFRENKGGINLTVKLDHQGKIPCFITGSNAREHDCKKIHRVLFTANDVVVFDCGYTDYSLTGQKVWFVTRLKKNTGFKRVKRNESLGKEWYQTMKSSFPAIYKEKHLRKIIVRDPADTGKKITLLTNNLKWSASTVSAVYKDRW
jgi:putative transposase